MAHLLAEQNPVSEAFRLQEAADDPNDPEEEEEEDDDDDDDDDIDAEAQELARRLGQQIWEDINKSQAVSAPIALNQNLAVHPISEYKQQSRKEEAVLLTMKSILSLIENDLPARNALETTLLPETQGNVFEILQQSALANSVPKSLCMPLSRSLVALAKSDVLFGSFRHSNAPAMELDKGKRRRESDENVPSNDQRPSKRPYIAEGDLYGQVSEAVRIITQALSHTPPQNLDPSLVASIRLELHQVFLFAVTSSPRGGHNIHALQEIGGLIQVIGVLSGIQIGQPPEMLSNQTNYPPTSEYSWISPPHSLTPVTDIGTAVYPCHVAGCSKTFSRLYSLRAHQRGHSTHRPFRCTICPASFARNHDLKRHVRLHDKKAWKCGGCEKIFSRRDAIKRHKNGSKTRGPKNETCINADVIEVDLDGEDGEDSMREERRAKLWNNMAVNGFMSAQGPYRDSNIMEEGEISPAVVSSTQNAVLSLQALLQSHVGNALGGPQSTFAASPDPTNSQATLASVIARAQTQNLITQQPHAPNPASLLVSSISSTTMSRNAGDTEGPQGNTARRMDAVDHNEASVIPSLSMYGLSDEQAKMLELAIANAASAAQAQAEAEAALEEEEEEESSEDHDSDDTDEHETTS